MITKASFKYSLIIPTAITFIFAIGFFFDNTSTTFAAITDCLNVSGNLIQNCSFETPGANLPTGYYPHSTGNYMFPAGYTGLSSWKVITPVALGNIGYFLPGFPSPSGVQILDISGFVDKSNLLMKGEQAGSGVEQTVNGLTPGQQYRLTFSQGYLSTFPSRIEVFINGVSQGTFSVDETTPGTTNISTVLWKEQSIVFTAGSSTATIRFTHAIPQPGGKIVVFGSALDNVSLVPIQTQVIPTNPAPTNYPDSIELKGIIRDFKGYNPTTKLGSPDFEKNPYDGSVILGLVNQVLGTDNKPVFKDTRGIRENNTIPNTASLTGKDYFDQWYNNVTGVNIPIIKSFNLKKSVSSNGVVTYTYDNNNFFPIDNEGFGNEGRSHNFHFTTEIHNTFTYVKGQYFTFSGDDDVWVFINNKLVVDIGGIHVKSSKSVNLDDLGLIPGNTYSLDIFHAERHTSESHFSITTSIVLDPVTPTITPTPTPTPSVPPATPPQNTTAPVVTIASNYTNPFYATKGHIITLNYTLPQVPRTQRVTIGDQVVDPVCIGTAPAFQCSAAIMVTQYMPLSDGLVPFSIQITGETRNKSTITATTDSSYVIVKRDGSALPTNPPTNTTPGTNNLGLGNGSNNTGTNNQNSSNINNNTNQNTQNNQNNTNQSNNYQNNQVPPGVLPDGVVTPASNSEVTSVWGTNYTANGPFACQLSFTQYLRKGNVDGQGGVREVGKIQKFLNEHLGINLSINGIFDTATDQAVRDFQNQYTRQIITPWKLLDPTGWWYQSTRGYANYLKGCSEGPVQLDNGRIILDGTVVSG